MSAIQSLSVPANNDVRAARAEQRAAMRERVFQRLDRDGSGGISRSEFSAALQNLPGAGNARGGASGGADRVSAIMAQLDTDGDGQVSAGELDTAMSRRQSQTTQDAQDRRAPAASDTVGGLLAHQTGHRHGPRNQDAVSAAAQYARAAGRNC